ILLADRPTDRPLFLQPRGAKEFPDEEGNRRGTFHGDQVAGVFHQAAFAVRDKGLDTVEIDEAPVFALFPFDDENWTGNFWEEGPGVELPPPHEESSLPPATADEPEP